MGAHESTPQAKEVRIELGEECSRKSDVYKLWTRVQSCTRNNTKGTLFVKDLGLSAESRQYFENGIKSLRQLRHPCILQYVDSQLLPTEARLFTERVQVLDLCIDSLSAIEIRAGLRSILDALIFLHTTASISHNAVCPSSIFVSPDGSWRLGGFEFARKYGGEKKDDHLLLSEFFKAVKPKPFSPPEDQKAMRSDNPPWARDSFGLGRLIEYALPYVEKDEGEESVLSSLRSSISSLCALTASERMRLEESTEMHAFSNPLSEVEHFVRTIQTKSEEEKNEFFDRSLSLISSLPPRVIGRRLARPLLSRYVILEGRAHDTILNHLLNPILPSSSSSDLITGLLPLDLYRETVLPECTHVLRVRDLHVRLAILIHIQSIAPHYSREQLCSVVLPEILIGLDDPDDRIVAATLKAMSILVPLVGADAVLGRAKTSESTPSSNRRGPHRDRAKIFIDGTPKASSAIDSVVSSTVCSPVHSRPVSPLREMEKRQQKITSIDTTQYQMSIVQESSVEEWNSEGNGEGWNDGWDEERKEEVNQEEEKKEKEEETRVVTVLKNTVDRSAIEPKKEGNNDIGSEFALKVTVKDEIDDLFAEMQPQIKTSGSILSQLEEIAVKSTRSTVSPSSSADDEKKDTVATTRLTFTASDEVGDSWGGEGEWGLDED
ncbi:hypothetical protein PRIPAC_70979 [Pristionchus pacificus]|uniref:Protein kinase domain-containing protein n=1 Tax=Pristionchus pacificus TaxID=54126 RepID=A0A2A6CZP6_PRIPA|nr:hypothetical protein PRIPAC_70979 [Pristionchus pacificus]|eukprot:PDM83635.1 protein kinase [Pristionchus pacificus]